MGVPAIPRWRQRRGSEDGESSRVALFVAMPENCVAYGCTNYIYGRENAKFFRFPSARLYPAKREAWIAAVRRRNTDGSPWQPNGNCRICSRHFVTGASILYAPGEFCLIII
ncbi:unnamed protein product [Ixodes hexagonus]